MASLTVRNIEADVETALHPRAARHGVSMENEIRNSLRAAARRRGEVDVETDQDREGRIARMLALGRPSTEPFDLKVLSDAIEDGAE